jgi:hypothetical protein
MLVINKNNSKKKKIYSVKKKRSLEMKEGLRFKESKVLDVPADIRVGMIYKSAQFYSNY